MGTPLWLMDLAAGGEFIPTSCFTHVGGLAIGLNGVARLGMPGGTWWKAALALVVLIGVCRLATPAYANVNVAFAIHPGWERFFSSHRVYLASMIAVVSAYFVAVEHALRRWLVPRPAQEERV
jgi:hypothetical protein